MKRNLLITFGGPSTEYEISLLSASSVISNVDSDLFDVHTVGITKEGKWLYTTSSPEDIESGKWENNEAFDVFLSTDPSKKGIIINKNNSLDTILIDVAFPVMHGYHGEDGIIQGLFESLRIPFVGSGVASSANCMDKTLTKLILNDASVPQASHITFLKGESINSILDKTESKFNYPVFIKPSSTGSSIGINKASDRQSLTSAINTAFIYGDKILIEEFLCGAEVEIAILGNQNPIASVCGEIAPSNDFYDFDAKYVSNSNLTIPANISNEVYNKLKEYALTAYKAIGCKGLSRIDFFVCDGENIILNEINTIPGFTDISMYSKLFAYSGIPYKELITKLIDFAMEI